MAKKCRRCANWFNERGMYRTVDAHWICVKCKSHDEEIVKKLRKELEQINARR